MSRRKIRDWLIAIGLAEPGVSVDKVNGGGVIHLNPILRHRSVLRDLGISG
jgi:hypothetical protein